MSQAEEALMTEDISFISVHSSSKPAGTTILMSRIASMMNDAQHKAFLCAPNNICIAMAVDG